MVEAATLISATLILILSSVPVFLFAGLGELFNELSGILNPGLEGIMLISALSAVVFGEISGNAWIGVIAGMAFGGLLGLLHGILSIWLKVDQVVSGTALWLFGLGATTYLGVPYIGPASTTIESNIAGLSPLFFISIALVFVFWFVIYKTNFGLRLRVVGEDPYVAEAWGVNVIRTRYTAVVVGGILAGLSGAYLSLVYAVVWSQGLVAGRGFIAFALAQFSFWRPLILLGGSIGFATLWIASIKLQGVILLSTNMLKMMPYAITLVVMIFASLQRFRVRLGAPAALAKPYYPRGSSD